ncbi:RusA family crossover junction endodeoxyribonuclease [Salinimicrobium sp. GXAS 041]|uniref:RusA family crossover junction endodeoxyribonuclease n=1 Tax=Salinimicrobium sp. GXAS 041 TaxID=3400806 RepID=UPI003C75741A
MAKNQPELQVIYGSTPSKSNCYRIIKIRGKSTLGKTEALKKYENDFYIQCNKYRDKMISGYFKFHMNVFYPSQRADLDNSLKVVLDCLQKAKAIKNDNKCTGLYVEKFLDKKNPRIEFRIEPV